MSAKPTDRYRAEGIENEFAPGSRGRVLRNRCRIVRVREMQLAESVALLEVQR
jgi:cell filamentation protein